MKNVLPQFVSLNGKVVASARARVSVFDRGLLYGDGLFETLRCYGGTPVGLQEHLARLQTSAAMLGIPLPDRPWQAEIAALLAANRLAHRDARVRINVTRGAGAPDLLPPEPCSPTVFIIAVPVPAQLTLQQRRGIRVTLLPFARQGWLAGHKLLNYVEAILGRVAARERGAQEALYVRDGRVIEGTTSNLFVCRRGRLITPPLAGLLPGVTRHWVIELARQEGLVVSEQPISVRRLRGADEAFVTSSIAEILPAVQVDRQPIGTGRVGPISRRLLRRYRQMVDRLVAQQALY